MQAIRIAEKLLGALLDGEFIVRRLDRGELLGDKEVHDWLISAQAVLHTALDYGLRHPDQSDQETP